MSDLDTLGVAEVAALVRRREVSPVEVAEDCMKRIEALEPQLHAWATSTALAPWPRRGMGSRQCDAGKPVEPSVACQWGLKIFFYTAGLRTAAGSRVYADFVPTYDATAVVRLKEAGAVSLGKTVTTEFATADPSPTRNPWNTAHTPGGSSSGSAAAVAARMIPAALGSQTGGSTLRPGSIQWYCRAQTHLRPHQPLWGYSGELVSGPCRHSGAQRRGCGPGITGHCWPRWP